MKPQSEQQFWAWLRPAFNDKHTYYWRMEDKIALGRPDVLYRFMVAQTTLPVTGVLELKMHPKPEIVKPFWSHLNGIQSNALIDWQKFQKTGFSAHLLMGIYDYWYIYDTTSPVINKPLVKRTLKEFSELARYRGEISDKGRLALINFLIATNLGKT